MARGDVTVFEEAKAYMLDGDFASTDDIKVAICDNTTTPTAADAVPSISGGTTNYTEVGSAGSYTAGGTSLGSIATVVTEAAGVMTFDSATNPTWTQNASNDTDAYWGIIYNDTDTTNRAIAFVDLGGPVDMTAGPLTITWNASGIFTIT
ncbi:MAG: hypothetical protein VW362_08910 [Candidatus Nanopelagicales bacterium]